MNLLLLRVGINGSLLSNVEKASPRKPSDLEESQIITVRTRIYESAAGTSIANRAYGFTWFSLLCTDDAMVV